MTALIELRDVHYAYEGHVPVLKGLSMALEPEERLVISGPNGAGKSTLLRIIVGLQHPIKGAVHAFGQQRNEEKDFAEVRRRAGFVFQDPDDQLFCPTVIEDIAFGPLNLGKSKAEAEQITLDTLSQLDLLHLKDRITYKLSGGEKRLISLACVLAMEPEVLLLDEPTNALDEKNEARLTEILLSLPQAMVIVSHDANFRNTLAHRQLYLKEGVLQHG
jgi:cobalt/nickel transport system ATP-binding protein